MIGKQKLEALKKWFRMLVKEKWTFDSWNRKGRPPIDPETEELILKLLKENLSWGVTVWWERLTIWELR